MKWDKLGLIATIGSIIFGLIGTACDLHEAKDKIKEQTKTKAIK